jgi:prevent-host-death family protein
MQKLPATEVKNRFGRVLRQVSGGGQSIIVERGGKPVAVIMSMGEYERLQQPPLDREQQVALLQTAFGMWSDRSDIDDEWLTKGRQRWTSRWSDE